MSKTVRVAPLLLASAALVTLWLPLSNLNIAHSAELTCGDDNCARLWLDDLPSTSFAVKLGKKHVSQLSDADICELLVFPIVTRTHSGESLQERCNHITIDSTRHVGSTGDEVN